MSLSEQFDFPSDRSRALATRAAAVYPAGSTRQTLMQSPFPLYAQRGEGCYLIDVDDNRRVDYINNFSALIHGHSHPAIVAAIQQQAARLTSVGSSTPIELELAELLTQRLPGGGQIRFCNSGSEAVMLAIKTARAFTGRPKIAKFEGAYHGSYDYAEVSQSPAPEVWGEPLPRSVRHCAGVPDGVLADVIALPFNDVEGCRNLLAPAAGELAAILLDPLVPRMHFVEARPDFLAFLAEFARANQALLICDEVYNFRLAYHGAQSVFGLTPDVTVLGKIIGGGLPIGAIVGSGEVMSVFSPDSRGGIAMPHGGTFNANPLTMAAGLASMKLLTVPTFQHLEKLGDRLRQGMERALRVAGVPGQVTGRGSCVGLVLDEERFSDYRSHARVTKRSAPLSRRLQRLLLARGVHTTSYGAYTISTAMSESIIDETLVALTDSLQALRGGRI